MELDLETFLTLLYVITDDLYDTVILPRLPKSGGPDPKLSDSEVLCLGLAAQWRSGVAWKTERRLCALCAEALAPLFPRHAAKAGSIVGCAACGLTISCSNRPLPTG